MLQKNYFEHNLETRVICDASTYGLVATLDHYSKEGV